MFYSPEPCLVCLVVTRHCVDTSDCSSVDRGTEDTEKCVTVGFVWTIVLSLWSSGGNNMHSIYGHSWVERMWVSVGKRRQALAREWRTWRFWIKEVFKSLSKLRLCGHDVLHTTKDIRQFSHRLSMSILFVVQAVIKHNKKTELTEVVCAVPMAFDLRSFCRLALLYCTIRMTPDERSYQIKMDFAMCLYSTT